MEILLIALAATSAGAETCVDMAAFGRAKELLLRRFLSLPGGIPGHDTFSHLFRLLDPEAFEVCFGRFVTAFAAQAGEAVTVGGYIVTADAMHCQKAAAQAILDRGGDHVLGLQGQSARAPERCPPDCSTIPP